MNPMRLFHSLTLAVVLTGLLSSGIALPAGARAASPAGYGPNDAYVLVKVCPAPNCPLAANWQPVQQHLHQLFHQLNWGADDSIGSRNAPTKETWAQWATLHLYYVDEPTPAARRAALAVVLGDLRGSAVHILPVAAAR